MAAPAFDPASALSSMQGLLGQFGPSPDDIAAANKARLMDIAAGLLGARRGFEFSALGQGLEKGQADYANMLKTLPAIRATNLQASLPLLQMAYRSSMMNSILNGGGPQPVSGGVQPQMTDTGAPQPFMTPTTSVQAFGGPQPPPAMLPTQQLTAPPGTDPSSVNGYVPPNPLTLMPPALKAAYAGSMDLGALAKGLEDFSSTTTNRTGLTVNKRGQPLYRVTDAGIQYYPASGMGETFVANPQSNTQAQAQYHGAISGSEKAAEEKAEFPYRYGTFPGPGGVPQSGYLGDIFGAPNAFSSSAPPSAGAPPPSIPAPTAAAASGAAPPPPAAPVTGAPLAAPGAGTRVVSGANPVALAGAKAAATETGEKLSTYEQSVHDAAASALTQNAQLGEMAKLANYFTPSATLPERAAFGNFVQDIPLVGRPLANAAVSNSAVALPAIQGFTKLAINMIAAQAKVFGSREAVQIVDMVKSALPNVGMVPGAPQTILSFMAGMNKYAADTEQAMSAWKAQHGGSINGFQEYWHATSPATKYVPPLSALAQIEAGQAPTMPNVSNPLGASGQQAPSGAAQVPSFTLTAKGRGNATLQALLKRETPNAQQLQILRLNGLIQ